MTVRIFNAALDYAVLCTLPRAELRATAELVRLGYTVFLPMATSHTGHATALFPGYAFVHLPNGDCLTVTRVGGVSRLLIVDGRAAHVSGRELAPLAVAERNGLFDRRQDAARFEIGAKVHIRGSWLEDHIGTLHSVHENERVSVLFQLFGASRIVRASLANVRPVA